MKRIDRLLSEARLLRIHRSSRARGLFRPSPELDWMAEFGTAQIILNDACSVGARAAAAPEPPKPPKPATPASTGQPSTKSPSTSSPSTIPPQTLPFVDGDPAIDFTVLVPFIARAQEALEALFAEMRPQDAILAEMWPRILGHFPERRAGRDPLAGAQGDSGGSSGEDAGDGPGEGSGVASPEPSEDVDLLELDTGLPKRRTRPGSDYMEPRRAAARDLAVLAAESVLFDVVRRVVLTNDAARAVSPHADGGGILVEGGRVRRVRPPRRVVNGDDRVRLALSGLSVPAEVRPPSKRLGPLEEKEVRDRRRREREAKAAAAAAKERGDPVVAEGSSVVEDRGPLVREGAVDEGAVDEGAVGEGAVDEGVVGEGAVGEVVVGEVVVEDRVVDQASVGAVSP